MSVRVVLDELEALLKCMEVHKLTEVETVQASFARGNFEDEFTGPLKNSQAHRWIKEIHSSLSQNPEQRVFIFDYNNQATEDSLWCHVPLWTERLDIAVTTVRTLEAKVWGNLNEPQMHVNPVCRGSSVCKFEEKSSRAFFSDQPGLVASYGSRFAQDSSSGWTLRVFRVPPRAILAPYIEKIWDTKPQNTIDVWIRHPEKPNGVIGVSNFLRSVTTVPNHVPDLQDLIAVGPVRPGSPVEEMILRDQMKNTNDSGEWETLLYDGLDLFEEMRLDELDHKMKTFERLQRGVIDDQINFTYQNLVQETEKIKNFLNHARDLLDDESVDTNLDEKLRLFENLLSCDEPDEISVRGLRDTIQNLKSSMENKQGELWEDFNSMLVEKLDLFDELLKSEMNESFFIPQDSISAAVDRLQEAPSTENPETATHFDENPIDVSDSLSSVNFEYERGLSLFDQVQSRDSRRIDYLPTPEVESFIERLKQKNEESLGEMTIQTANDSSENSSTNLVYEEGMHLFQSIVESASSYDAISSSDIEGMLIKLRSRAADTELLAFGDEQKEDQAIDEVSRDNVRPRFVDALNLDSNEINPNSVRTHEEVEDTKINVDCIIGTAFDFDVDDSRISNVVNPVESFEDWDTLSAESEEFSVVSDIKLISPIRDDPEYESIAPGNLVINTNLSSSLHRSKPTFSGLSLPLLSGPMISPFTCTLGTPMNMILTPVPGTRLVSPDGS